MSKNRISRRTVLRGLGATMAQDEEGGGGSGFLSPRVKALAIALLVDLLCIPLVFVLILVWPVVILAIVPYVGGALGGRYVDRSMGLKLGALAAAIMVSVIVASLMAVLSAAPVEGFDPLEATGLSIVAAAYVVAILFGALGGRHGAMAVEEE